MPSNYFKEMILRKDLVQKKALETSASQVLFDDSHQ